MSWDGPLSSVKLIIQGKNLEVGCSALFPCLVNEKMEENVGEWKFFFSCSRIFLGLYPKQNRFYFSCCIYVAKILNSNQEKNICANPTVN